MGKLALKEGMTGVVALAVRCTVTVTDFPCLCCQVAKDLDVELKSVREAAAAAKSAMHRTKADAEARLAELTATVKEQTEEATAAAETAASLSAQLETARTEAEAAKGKLATVQTSLDRQTAACEKCVSVVSRCMLVLTAILHSIASMRVCALLAIATDDQASREGAHGTAASGQGRKGAADCADRRINSRETAGGCESAAADR